jgi:hypothetical protein
MDENEDITMQEALRNHVCDLVATMDELDPASEEYKVISDAVTKLSDILIRIEEIEMKHENEEVQRQHEVEMEQLKEKAAQEAREAEERLKAIEQKELKRWHNIDMGLRIAAVVATVLTTVAFTGVTLVQTRMNYVDNVYDAAPASRMILNAIGKLVKPPQL